MYETTVTHEMKRCCGFKSDSSEATVTTLRQWFYNGDSLPVKVELDNTKSSKPVRSLQVMLRQMFDALNYVRDEQLITDTIIEPVCASRQADHLDLDVKVEKHQKTGKTGILHPDQYDVKLAQSYTGKIFSIEYILVVEGCYPAQKKLAEQKVIILNKPCTYQKSKVKMLKEEPQETSMSKMDISR